MEDSRCGQNFIRHFVHKHVSGYRVGISNKYFQLSFQNVGAPVYVNAPMFRYSNLLIGYSKQYLTFALNTHSACKLCLLFKPKQVFTTTERLLL